MPEMDGEDTLQAIRAEMNVPVMIISAINDKKVIIHMLQAGADDYVVKPFDESVLLARARQSSAGLKGPAQITFSRYLRSV